MTDFWWIKDDCCGVFCGLMTNMLLFFALFVQLTFVIGPKFGILHPFTLFYIFLTAMAVVSHCRTQFTNPGAVPLDSEHLIDLENQTKKNQRRYCTRCKQYKPADAHHCSSCHRCIIRMDHHCPWVNNCVAMYNQKYFVLFLFYTALCCIFCMASLISRFISCNGHSSAPHLNRYGFHSHHLPSNLEQKIVEDVSIADQTLQSSDFDWCNAGSLDVLFCIMNVFEGVLFGLFTCIMSCDQISSIISNVTYIDSLNMNRVRARQKRKTSGMENLSFVFGEPFSMTWFLPSSLTPKIRENFNYLCQEL